METCKFIGCACGEKNGRQWFMVFLARFSAKFNTWTCWSGISVEASEYAEFGILKFGDEVDCHFFNGMLKDYTIKKSK